MTQLLTKTIADFTTTLTTATAVGATTGTLTSGLDADGIQLPTATYGFTVDRNNAQKEHFTATLTGAALTDIKHVTRGTGVGSAGLTKTHRKGAEVIITDHVAIKRIMDVLDGTTNLDSSTILEYDGTVTPTTANQLAPKSYVDGVAIAGAADASTTVKGISKLSTAPASPTNPIAVGDNDTRVPTQGENDALVGTSGTPSSSNKFVTEDDPLKGSPTGMVSPYAGSSAPTGWLLADGTAVSRTTYASLFAVVSTTYGVGDGSTTFNVPNLKGKIPVGYNTAETEFDVLGETGGAKTHTLITAEMPAHTHDTSVPNPNTGSGPTAAAVYSGLTTGTYTSASTGSGTAHNNLQPYIALNYIIKY